MKNIFLVFISSIMATPVWAQISHEVGYISSSQDVVPQGGSIHFAAGLFNEKEWKENFRNLDPYFRPRPGYISMREYDPVESNENLEVFRSEASFVVSSANVNSMFQNAEMYNLAQVVATGFTIEKISPETVNKEYQDKLLENYSSAVTTNKERRDRSSNPISTLEYTKAQARLDNLYGQNKKFKWCNTDQGEPTCLKVNPDFGLLNSIVSVVTGNVYLYSEMVGAGVDSNHVPAEIASIPYTPTVLLALNGAEGSNLIQFTRTVISFHPVDGTNTLVVIQHVTGIEASDLDKVTPLLKPFGGGSSRDFIMGEAVQNFGGGLSEGLPSSQYKVAFKLKQYIEAGVF